MSFPLKRTSHTQNFPFPAENEVVYENPPCLVFVPINRKTDYTVTVRDEDENVVFEKTTDKNYVYDTKPWKSGRYFWNVTSDSGKERGTMSFTLSEDAIIAERPDAKSVFDSIPQDLRPRHLFSAEDIPALLEDHKSDLEILKRNAEIAYSHGLPPYPKFHHYTDALPYREYFGEYRDYCDRDLIACSLLYALTGDKKSADHAKNLLLTICDMNPLGPCSLMGEWGDEVGLSNARCLPAAFDMLFELLDEKQRKYVAGTIAIYARQCEARIKKINYAENPSHSHVGRLPAYLGEAALVLKGTGVESDEALTYWLDTALDIYNGIFPFYGCRDGSWAEGAFFSTSYTKWYLPFFSAVERFSQKSLFTRPFYARYTQYLLHFCNEKFENHPFGDGYWSNPTDTEWPGFFAQNPYRVYADRFGPELAKSRMKSVSDIDYFRLHLLDIFLPKPGRSITTSLTGEVENCALFPEGGFCAMHTDINSDKDICVMMRASKYTADSHRHADQGSFALFYKGLALISPSGYFGRKYGSIHHTEWTKKTVAHNVALINGVGQISDINATGRFIGFDKTNRVAKMDITKSYEKIKKYERTVELDEGGITVTDYIEADEPVTVKYPLHTLALPTEENGAVTILRDNCRMRINVLCGLKLDFVTDKFDVDLNEGVESQYQVSMPKQYHVYYSSDAAEKHLLKVRFDISDL